MKPRDLKRNLLELPNLPAWPRVGRVALSLRDQAERRVLAELAPLAHRDAALAERLCVAACAGMPQPPMDTVEQALARLGGEGALREVLLYAFALAFRDVAPTRLAPEAFGQHARLCAEFAHGLAEACEYPHPAEANAAGLLHDIGKAALDLVSETGYSSALEAAQAQGLYGLEAERRELGADHGLAGKWLAEHWELPESFHAAIWLHHHPHEVLESFECPLRLIDLVAVADMLAHQYAAGNASRDHLPAPVAERLGCLGLNAETVLALQQQPLEMGAPAAEASPAPAVEGQRNSWESLERYKLLYEAGIQLARAKTVEAVLHLLVDTVRHAFRVPSGLCFCLHEETGAIEGCSWKDDASEPRAFRMTVERGSEGGRPAEALDRLLAELLPEGDDRGVLDAVCRHGLASMPLAANGVTVGQLILDAGVSRYALQAEAFGELLALGEAFAARLDECRVRDRKEADREGLATALWQQELAHRQSNRAERLAGVARLAAGAAHEINNPLAAISGRAQLLLSRAKDPEDAKALSTIVEQSQRVTNILSGLTQFARPGDPNLEPTLVGYVLHQVVASMGERLAQKGIEVVEDYAAGMPRVPIDRRQMQQVFFNLLANAEQAMRGRTAGRLRVRARPSQDGRSAVIQIADTGHGIPSELVGDVFEPFFTTREEAENTGLGLAVCQGIIERHRGSINLHSDVGEGTTCTITLPTVSEKAEEVPGESPKTAAAAPREQKMARLLLVMEDEDLREVLKQSLRNRGFEVRAAADGLEALAAVLAYPVDVTILDLAAGPVDGVPVLECLREREPGLRVIALSGPGPMESASIAREMGAQACLRKPFEIARLFEAIQRLLAERHAA